ncbi:hypothetical protein BESB_034040 [Besnoitia besnoiti]|uniref:SRS domain-containing protein n=1 Tax=Besnoitia besnoiti TaxID=94643 RepID=A0A2A9MLM5_BESBE|nr:hypothetical protein BESB_034040 [Besnoitia besnoiti]PFH36946.1 hypothetical protein BESB_034040 [Besnoitia besnoiti]
MSAHPSRGKAFGLFVVVSAALVLSGAVLLMCTGLRHPEKWRSVAGNICSTAPELGQVALQLTVEPGERDTWFSCGANPPAVLQPSQQGMVFEGTSCQTTRSLSSVSAGAKLHTKVDGGQTWYRLDIPSNERKNQVLCYTCKQAVPHKPKNKEDGTLQIEEPVTGRTCTVRITLKATTNRQLQYKAEEEEGQGEAATSRNQQTGEEAASNDDLNVTVCSHGTVPASVAQGAPLAFQCAAGMLLEPKGGQEAFDGDCNNHAPLTSFVDASLETQSLTTQNDAQTTYKLRVTNSPVTPVSICYKCVYRVDAAEYVSEQCHLKISVIPTAHAGAPARGMTLVSIGLLGLIWLSSM